ncbi:MAG: hypothetical protein CHACPFDD_03339 [Phycisphaerae bacterium]|nr:hypothetical protein [Phycisphaerae bacterium]
MIATLFRSACLLLLAGATLVPASADVRVKNLKTLVVIYRGDRGSKEYMSDADVESARAGVELGRLFYFRNSAARLNCELIWLVADAQAPKNDGPTMEHIEADLKQRGVRNGQYDGIFVTGIGLSGNWGGFNIFNGTAACFGGHGGRGELSWYPSPDATVAYGTAWNFVHEFQHAIDLVTAQDSNRPDMLHAHPYTDRNEPFFKGCYQGGEHWDWIACTFREFDGWTALKGVHNAFLDCADADGDGLPDDDARLPTDEKRFNSDPTKKDTDGDGLDDLAEFTADRYAGSEPRAADTDGDGTRDGDDRYPLIALAAEIPFGSEAPLLRSVFARNDEGGDCLVSAAWNSDGLTLRFTAPRRFAVDAKLDGSAANGFWDGGDTYLLRITPDDAPNATGGKVEFRGLGLSGPVAGATVQTAQSDGRFTLTTTIPARLGQGVSKEINYGGKREPEDVTDGLTLVPGREIGVNFGLEFADHQRDLLTPLHTMYAVRLGPAAGGGVRPILRGPALTSARSPVVTVAGVAADAPVEIVSGSSVLGARVGPGDVMLVDILTRGAPASHGGMLKGGLKPYELDIAARAGGASSAPLRMRVDASAAAPVIKLQDGELRAECEPRAQLELWWGVKGMPAGVLFATRADEAGGVVLKVDESLTRGWLVSAYEGSRFEKLVYVETWPQIDRNFRGDAPDPRLPGDAFSYRFESYLPLPEAVQYEFELGSDDGSRLYVDDELIINHWGHHGMATRRATVSLAAGVHRLRIEYCELDGWAGVKFRGAPRGTPLSPELPVRTIPAALASVELMARQSDALGNVSPFVSTTPAGEAKPQRAVRK